MITEIYDCSLFISRFEDYGRVETKENPNGNFTRFGLRFLFDYLDEAYDEENPLELDVIALCCDFKQYGDGSAFLIDYPSKLKDVDFEGMREYWRAIEEEINDNTTLIKLGENLSDGFIIGSY